MNRIFSNLDQNELDFQSEVTEYCANEIEPYVENIEQGKMDIFDVIKPMGKKRYIGTSYPEEYGGLNKSLKHELILDEAISYHSLPVGLSRWCSIYPASLILNFNKTEKLGKYIESLCKGEKIGCFCFTEPDAGSDLSRMKTIYEKDEANSELILNGEKRFITNGSIADVLVVYGRNGACIVESKWQGVEVLEEYKLMGLHGLHLGHLKFNNVRIPQENVLFYQEIAKDSTGKKKGGKTLAISSMQQFLSVERVTLSVQTLSVARRAIEVAIDYSRERVQFKKSISEFEGISFKIAHMVTNYEAGRALLEKAVNNVKDGYLAAMAKLFVCQNSYKICDEAIQILGGIGYTNKYPVERYARDVRLYRIGGGTDEIMQYIIQKGVYRK